VQGLPRRRAHERQQGREQQVQEGRQEQLGGQRRQTLNPWQLQEQPGQLQRPTQQLQRPPGVRARRWKAPAQCGGEQHGAAGSGWLKTTVGTPLVHHAVHGAATLLHTVSRDTAEA